MPNGNVFDKVLAISTPGFDRLANTIQSEAERIRQNQAVAAKRKAQLQLTQLESDLSLSRQRQMQAEQQEDYLERLAIQQEAQEDTADEELDIYRQKRQIDLTLYEGKRRLDKAYQSDGSVVSSELLQNASDIEENFYQDYEDVYQQNLLPEPNVTPIKSEQGQISYVVQDNEGNIIGTDKQFRQFSSDLGVLARFMNGLSETANLVETPDGQNIRSGNTVHITRSNASQELEKIYSMTLDEKREYAQRVNMGQVAIAPKTKFGSHSKEALDKADQDDGPEANTAAARNVRSMFVNLPKDNKNINLILPKQFTEQEKYPVNYSLQGKNMSELSSLKDKLLKHAKDEEYLVETEDGKWTPAEDLDEQGQAAINTLTKVRPLSTVFQEFLQSKSSFGGRQSPEDFRINFDWNPDDKLQNLWQQKETFEEEETLDPDYKNTLDLLNLN